MIVYRGCDVLGSVEEGSDRVSGATSRDGRPANIASAVVLSKGSVRGE